MGAKYINKVEDSTGYKKTKIGVLPSDWEVKKLSDVSCINRESLNGNIDADYEFYYYDLSCVDNGKIYKPNNKIKFKEAPSRARRVFQKNDILFSMVRPYLKGFAYIDFECKDCICSTGFSVISSNKANDAKFIYYNLFGTVIENQVNKLLVGSNYPAINSSDVENLKIPYPKLDMEREKIGNILSTWDKAIELKEKLIEQKKEQKKGLMQRLLTGKVRLPGFEGEWEEVQVKDVCEIGRGRVISKKEIEQNQGIYPVYSSQTSNNGEIGRINTYDYDGEYITWTTDGVNAGTVFYRKGKFNCTNVCGTLKLLRHDIDARYFSLMLQGETDKYVVRHGNPKLMNNVMAIITVRIFNNYEYQKFICDIFDMADREITLLEQEVEALKQQKKGLMQLLLTGKVRVKC
ncbi:type I restriction enzyme, S subunit [Carboxydocella sporoproducens DSM 16521]|uniref:Type I restriction enzyme, S subunit n=2 Tax=Carboxydocella TaxID=178898 RepID=A0A1T4SHH6_9FIRM|nr:MULTISPECIES: restriction endonuclease subunit S [Carboxydocella]AVX19624.1 type I restriction enzyme, S subunit [Carboxydocella thermautotrophica]SKA27754.1 type I restriction enzyme, S subunit [Carboxydocella sporoproducens DSM 16521]